MTLSQFVSLCCKHSDLEIIKYMEKHKVTVKLDKNINHLHSDNIYHKVALCSMLTSIQLLKNANLLKIS